MPRNLDESAEALARFREAVKTMLDMPVNDPAQTAGTVAPATPTRGTETSR